VTVGETPRAGRREWVGLAVIALPCLLITMDLTVLYLVVPKLSADLKPTSSQLLWILNIYGFLLAGFLVTMGTLGDRIGRRRLLDAAREAFIQGLHLAAITSAALVLGIAILVLVLLRDVRADTGPVGQPGPRHDRAFPGSAPET
jgi:MFS transporter, DHA2 family, multidrug resistance protein